MMFRCKRPIKLHRDERPRLIVVVDTEEEFDWSSEPNPNLTNVTAMEHIERVHSIFQEYRIQPCYAVTYPIASQPEGYQLLKQYHDAGECEIGAQLHPWVTLPLEEQFSRSNMYPGNLPQELERKKIACLRDQIQESFGLAPVSYKAGRYGFGPNTECLLQEMGFTIDLSVCPPLDFTEEGGPDYEGFTAEPFWFGDQSNPMLEIPCTGSYVGLAQPWARHFYSMALSMRQWHVPGILSRLGILDRLMLSPEGYTPEEHIKLTRFLYGQGVRTFTWSFHSPSVVPGHTTYVQSEEQLVLFLNSFRRYFDFFFNELGGEAITPSGLRSLVEAAE